MSFLAKWWTYLRFRGTIIVRAAVHRSISNISNRPMEMRQLQINGNRTKLKRRLPAILVFLSCLRFPVSMARSENRRFFHQDSLACERMHVVVPVFLILARMCAIADRIDDRSSWRRVSAWQEKKLAASNSYKSQSRVYTYRGARLLDRSLASFEQLSFEFLSR